MKMKARSKSEWFELNKPIGEPEIVPNYQEESYWIERIVNNDGEIVWFGQGTNWISKDGGKSWKYLSEDLSVEPLEKGGCTYPENRLIWRDCELPIYEKLYLELKARVLIPDKV